MTGIACAHHHGLVKGLLPCAIENHDAGLTDSVTGYDQAPSIDQIDISDGRIAHHDGGCRTPKTNMDHMIDADGHHGDMVLRTAHPDITSACKSHDQGQPQKQRSHE